jgi:hypothetical protein
MYNDENATQKKAAFNASSLYGGCANEKQLYYKKGFF